MEGALAQKLSPRQSPQSHGNHQHNEYLYQKSLGFQSNTDANTASGAHVRRRVSIGEMQGSSSIMDRRGSLVNVEDILSGRRGSVGFDMGLDMGMDTSMKSIAPAALDASLLEYHRRRYSMVMGGHQGDLLQGPVSTQLRTTPSTSLGSFEVPSMLSARSSSLDFSSNQQGDGTGTDTASILLARRKFVQQQRHLLEKRQKELEMQRQQLIATMQERNGMLPLAGNYPQVTSDSYPHFSQVLGSNGLDGSMRGDSMGGDHMRGDIHDISIRTLDVPQRSSNASTSSQWWVCQVCNAKAFATHDQAIHHENSCHGIVDPANPRSSQKMMGVDHSANSAYNDAGSNISSELFTTMNKPMPLIMDSDKDFLTPLHCFVRSHCVEVFTATEEDVDTPSKGKRKSVSVGQVGIRCPHCNEGNHSAKGYAGLKARERGSVYYPASVASIYNATMNLLQRHLHNCPSVPGEILQRYDILKADDARSATSKRYWIESALSLGLVDSTMGIRFLASMPPLLPSAMSSHEESKGLIVVRQNDNDFFSTNSNAIADMPDLSNQSLASAASDNIAMGSLSKLEQDLAQTAPLVDLDDKANATNFSFHLMSQMQPCTFTEADRLGKRKNLPSGYSGLACRHCFGEYGSGRFFPATIKTLSDTSKSLNVIHNHMMRCRKCPVDVRESLNQLRSTHDEERAKMKFGSQKAFFGGIWSRLHGKDHPQLHANSSTKRFKKRVFELQNDRAANGIDVQGMMPLQNWYLQESDPKRQKTH